MKRFLSISSILLTLLALTFSAARSMSSARPRRAQLLNTIKEVRQRV